MKSIEAADYFGSRRPHITIELPAEIDPPTLDFLENIVWPPIDRSGAPHASQLTLRHRLPRYGFTTAEASTHFIESFYPARSKDSHVLLLSPQAELSPVYYHYIIYNLLEYKYSKYGQQNHDSKNLMGLSLELPLLYLNNSAKLVPPTLDSTTVEGSSSKENDPTPFLWQAPNCNAALYFGDKWIELHSFLSSRITIQDPDLSDDERLPTRQKVISEYYPAWMEYVQELMRAREYSLLYPNFPQSKDAIVAVHSELYQPPEEYKPSRPLSSSAPLATLNSNDPFIIDPSAHSSTAPIGSESPLLTSSLMSILSNLGDLLELTDLPILSFEGNVLSDILSEATANNFASDFRREIGKCNANHQVDIDDMNADDLFCNLKSSRAPLDMDSQVESHQDDGSRVENGQKDEPRAERKSQHPLESSVTTSEHEPRRNTKEQSDDISSEKTDTKSKGRFSPAKKNKPVQNEFTEHLRRQGVKAASDDATNDSKKQIIDNKVPKPELLVSEGGLMKERNKAFETVNGNLVRKEKTINENLNVAASSTPSPSVENPAKSEQYEHSKNMVNNAVKENTDEGISEESQTTLGEKGKKLPKAHSAQPEKTGLKTAAKEDEEASSKTQTTPTETTSAAPERERGW